MTHYIFSMSMNFSDLSGHIFSKVQFTTFFGGKNRVIWHKQRSTKPSGQQLESNQSTARWRGVVGVVTVLATVRPVRGVGAASAACLASGRPTR